MTVRQPVVFVVDDEEQICVLLQRTLARDGLRVLAYTTADQALTALSSERPDLIVTDMMMPGTNGLDFAQRALAVSRDVSVIVITGYASLENVVDALRSGVDDFVTKPFSASEIRAVVARVLSRRGKRDPSAPSTAEVSAAAVQERPPENQALARRLRDMALLESVHGVMAEDLASEDVLGRCRGTLEGALGVRRAVLAVPTLDGRWRIASAVGTPLAHPQFGGTSAEPAEVGFLSLVAASGTSALCGRDELGAFGDLFGSGPCAAAPLARRDVATSELGVLVVGRDGDGGSGKRFEAEELRVLSVLGPAIGDVFRALRNAERAEEAYVATLEDIVEASENRAPWFRDHGRRVRDLALALARRLGFAESELAVLGVAARILDLGRVELADEVLHKTSRLTPDEWRAVRAHCEHADQMVRPVGRLRHVKPVLRHHHENWDGSGYPDGLRGDAIPPLAAVVRIADAFAALTAPRPWRGAMQEHDAIRNLVELSGSHFHPQYVAAFAEMRFESGAGGAP
ncbi:MAG: Regulator of RpoS [Planctomycetes bacterium]|nr:Regulator of RpoS [Planctomycetota bacterium]